MASMGNMPCESLDEMSVCSCHYFSLQDLLIFFLNSTFGGQKHQPKSKKGLFLEIICCNNKWLAWSDPRASLVCSRHNFEWFIELVFRLLIYDF
jgi:hypothetical protein